MYVFSIHFYAHLKGKANEIWVVDPEGERQKIFGIDTFHKSFESCYTFEEPFFIPKGSSIEYMAWFDNSENKPENPDPTKNHLEIIFRG